MLFWPISQIPAMAMGLVTAMLPLQTSESSCGYAVSAALINIMRTSAFLAGLEDLEREKYKYPCIPVFENDRDLARNYGKTPPISLADIKTIIACHGIDSMVFKFSPKALHKLAKSINAPLILHVRGQFSHFVLIIDVKSDFKLDAETDAESDAEADTESVGILLFDPSCGLVLLSEHRLKDLVSGYCLLPIRYSYTPGEKPLDIGNFGASFASLKTLLWTLYCKEED